MLAVPASIERIFLTGGNIITPERNRLSELASEIIFLKDSWKKVEEYLLKNKEKQIKENNYYLFVQSCCCSFNK